MHKQHAQKIIRETFEHPFEKARFAGFVRNLLNRYDDDAFAYHGNLIPDAYKPFVSKYERIGKYHDGENRIDILIVHLNRETSLERARTMQRNFVAGYLQAKYGSAHEKEAALVAFVSPDEADWRFSLVKMDYRFDENGRV
ncbi:MAG: class I SAM-dependent DNA methyltransferase, partial [bacterium]